MFQEANGDPYFFDRGIDTKKLRSTFSGDAHKPKARKVGDVYVPKYTAHQTRIWKALVDVCRGGGSVTVPVDKESHSSEPVIKDDPTFHHPV